MNVAINMGGGFGDILRVYLSGDCGFGWCQPFWGRAQQWLEETGNKLNVVVSSHNPHAVEFFETIPWINKVIKVPWRHENSKEVDEFLKTENCVRLQFSDLNRMTKHIKWHMPKIYLSDSEQRIVDEISRNDFVFFYPFGGYGARIHPVKYLALVNNLVERGLMVVVGGGTHTRYTGGLDDKFIREELDFDPPAGMINVVGHGVRLCAALAVKANAFIGSLGCYMHAALAVGIPSFVLTCYEVWDDDNVCGKNVSSNQALDLLMRNIEGTRAELYVLLNEDKSTLKDTYEALMLGLFHNITGGVWRMGSGKRHPVHV